MFLKRCCRTCLTTDGLHPIFHVADQKEKYSNAIYINTGLKVEPNDSLPQYMCVVCINFINDMLKFRKKCHKSNKILNATPCNYQVMETVYGNIKAENPIHINIEDLDLESDCEIEDYDDVLNEPSIDESVLENIPKVIELEPKVEHSDLEDVPLKVFMKNKKVKKKFSIKRRVKKQDKIKEIETEDRVILQNDDNECENEDDGVRQNIECEHCHKILTSKLSLRNHYKIHTGFDVVCEHCGKKFITRRLLLMHCRAKHGYEKTDKCSYCDYRASNAEQVKIHERLHTGEKPYVCSECGRGFHRNSSYLQHRAIHLPEKTVACDECPARFKSVTLMKIHKTRHKRPQYAFKCLVCNNTFARRRNVARHLLMIHGTQPAPEHIDKVHIS